MALAFGCSSVKTPQVRPCRLHAAIHGGIGFTPLQPKPHQHRANDGGREGRALPACCRVVLAEFVRWKKSERSSVGYRATCLQTPLTPPIRRNNLRRRGCLGGVGIWWSKPCVAMDGDTEPTWTYLRRVCVIHIPTPKTHKRPH